VIGALRRRLSSAFGRQEPTSELSRAKKPRRDNTQRRIDDARRRLKATIPPPED
jgi:hypothetical protein